MKCTIADKGMTGKKGSWKRAYESGGTGTEMGIVI
jgi:hypothetical protein